MSGLLRVLAAGLGNTLQDAGRTGYRHMGIACSGFIDPWYAACANVLAGNTPLTTALEIPALGPTLLVERGPVRVALSGPLNATILRAGGAEQALPPWQSALLHEGDQLKIAALTGGRGYLAVSGGFAVPEQLGSRSTYARAAIGGLAGRALQVGDGLPCAQALTRGEQPREQRANPWLHRPGPVHLMPGPQHALFKEADWLTLLSAPYQLTSACDRMGLRLAGPALVHGNTMISDGIAPGAMQIAGDGQPIILLADCQTVGGYPKIACVVSADLPRLAQWPADRELRFVVTDLAGAAALRAADARAWADWHASLQPLVESAWLDELALYQSNLISGVLRGDEADASGAGHRALKHG